ncbi:uncharacterized protein PAC_20023 [Phialocephala subalpina]|uniref:C2H2-type domain-containing protein n=1 Tax=Phialocephala subalpina TaxID=576137 RepID=A0A1L7XYH1_9HELO|nr:uncharacterized protein PAC_20023 [Phialocephala subalpina]
MSQSFTDPRDHREPNWQLDESLDPFSEYYDMQGMEIAPSITHQSHISSQWEASCLEVDWSRDQTFALGPSSRGNFFTELDQPLNHLESTALLDRTNYTAPAALSPPGTHTSSSFSLGPGSDVIDQVAPTQWAQGLAYGCSLMPFVPQDSYGYAPNIPTLHSAIPDFQRDADLREAFSEINMMQFQHAQIQPLAANTCQQCNIRFENKITLDNHAKQTQHGTYACVCGETFSRFDCLNRHLDRFNPGVLHPCLYCSKYSGSNAFHRRDHLIQHLRNFHHHADPDETHDLQISFHQKRPARKRIPTCPHDGCAYHSQPSTASLFSGNSQQLVFQTQKEYTKHLREVHNESRFPCPALRCDRIGGKGYFRKKDLLKHEREHSGASHFGSPVQSEPFTSPSSLPTEEDLLSSSVRSRTSVPRSEDLT